jgi:hypothetical protein
MLFNLLTGQFGEKTAIYWGYYFLFLKEILLQESNNFPFYGGNVILLYNINKL